MKKRMIKILNLMQSDRVHSNMFPCGDQTDDIPEDVMDEIEEWTNRCSTAEELDVLLSLPDRWQQELLLSAMSTASYRDGAQEGDYALEDDVEEQLAKVIASCITQEHKTAISRIANEAIRVASRASKLQASRRKKGQS